MERPDRAPERVADFVRAWSAALRGTGYVPLTPTEREQRLTALAARLARAVATEPLDPAVGYRVGADLVAAGFAAPEVLGRTVTVVNTRLASDLGLAPDPSVASRVTTLVEALAAGFSGAVHDRALDAQEEVRLAALAAQARAEEALRRSEARFRHLATHDSLTGLPNWRFFADGLAANLATATNGTRLGVCCVGLDGFAAVNDSLGHQVGDRLLLAAADRLRSLTASSGHLVARLDSDQFAILVERSTCREDVIKVADRAMSVLAEPFQIGDNELPLTASVGVVEEQVVHGSDANELIRAAQIALHWAKADGKGRWRLFHRTRSAEDAARYRLSAAMPGALRRGEFTLEYQPLIDLAGDRLVGFEALARWRHPEHGLLGADRFIGLAADTGLIVPLGNHLLEQACQQAAGWSSPTGEPPYVSVNLAVRQLRQEGLVGHVASVLDRTGLSPHRLQLEITEDVVIGTDEQVAATLADLVNLGVRIVVDDFGTGYSNLAYLRRLPLHGLKLDAAFAERTPGSDAATDEAFLAAIVNLGHTLGLQVTAEGIETADHLRRMRAIGCDVGQGWHLGYPAPTTQVRHLLGRR